MGVGLRNSYSSFSSKGESKHSPNPRTGSVRPRGCAPEGPSSPLRSQAWHCSLKGELPAKVSAHCRLHQPRAARDALTHRSRPISGGGWDCPPNPGSLSPAQRLIPLPKTGQIEQLPYGLEVRHDRSSACTSLRLRHLRRLGRRRMPSSSPRTRERSSCETRRRLIPSEWDRETRHGSWGVPGIVPSTSKVRSWQGISLCRLRDCGDEVEPGVPRDRLRFRA